MNNLVECRLIDKMQVINEGSKTNPKIKVRGVFQRADEANSNGRVYPFKVLENQVNALQDKIKSRSLVGACDHPANDVIHLSQASHLITGLWMEGNEVFGEAEILSTPAGQIIKALITDGVKVGISSRGLGSLSEGSNGHKVVNEDFRLLTFDIVADPSTRGAYPSLTESVKNDSKRINKIVRNTIGKEAFIKMIETKLDEILCRKDERCWPDFEPTPGVPPYAEGSCRPKKGKKKAKKAPVVEANLLDKGKSPKEKAEARTKRAKKDNPFYAHHQDAEVNNYRATDHHIANKVSRNRKKKGGRSARQIRKDRRNAYQTRGSRKNMRQDSSTEYNNKLLSKLQEMLNNIKN